MVTLGGRTFDSSSQLRACTKMLTASRACCPVVPLTKGARKMLKLAKICSPETALHPMLQLQQAGGNQLVQEILQSGHIQAKLFISSPDDPEERGATGVQSSAWATYPSGCRGAVAERTVVRMRGRRLGIAGIKGIMGITGITAVAVLVAIGPLFLIIWLANQR